jgi:hypothetical protein
MKRGEGMQSGDEHPTTAVTSLLDGISVGRLSPQSPYAWPEPRTLAGLTAYVEHPPFQRLALASRAVFGTILAPTSRGIDVLDSWLTNNPEIGARLLVFVYPTCATRRSDLIRLLEIVKSRSGRLSVRIHPLDGVSDRATNVLCFQDRESEAVHVAIGPTENVGTAVSEAGHVNLVFRPDAALLEAIARNFNWFWGRSREITADGITHIPELVIPTGTEQAARDWRQYVHACTDASLFEAGVRIVPEVDPKTGEVTLISEDGEKISSPTEELDFPKLDPLGERIARLYEKGAVVSVDKLSRIPPLDAPFDPKWFGDHSELQAGAVTRKVSMRVSIIDEETLKKIEKCRKGLRELLTRLTFGLADNMRWMPHAATRLFESELERVNTEGQGLIHALLKGDVDGFVKGKQPALLKGLQDMHQTLGRQGQIPDAVIDMAMLALTERLKKATTANFMPTLTYSSIGFQNAANNNWASPWTQAYTLLAGIAKLPREAATNPYFFRGWSGAEDDLLEAMNVADDALHKAQPSRNHKVRCQGELNVLGLIETTSLEPRDRCDLVCRVIDGHDLDEVTAEVGNREKK